MRSVNVLLKAALTFLLTTILLAAFTVFAWTGFFGHIETNFYAPALVKNVEKRLSDETKGLSAYLDELNTQFALLLKNDFIRRSFSVNQDQIDIFERSRIVGELLASMPALQWIRFVDLAGNRIHFSTETVDVVIRSGNTVAYRPWTDVPRYIRITEEMTSGQAGIIFDGDNERLVFYMTIYDMDDIKQGVALFSMTSRIIADKLVLLGYLGINDTVSLISSPAGIVPGLRSETDGALKETVAGFWQEHGTEAGVIHSPFASFKLFSQKTWQQIFVGKLVDEKFFELPFILKMMILAVFGITVFIIIFWFMNLKQDPVVIIQHRMKRLQISLLNEYFDLKDDMDWRQWKRAIAGRREDVRRELLRGFNEHKNAGVYKYVNSFFDKSWDDFVAVISSRSRGDIERLDEQKVEDILKRIMKATLALAETNNMPEQTDTARSTPAAAPVQKDNPANTTAPAAKPAPDAVEELDEVEAVEEAEAVEEFDEIEAVEELDEAEVVEELDEIEAAGAPPAPVQKNNPANTSVPTGALAAKSAPEAVDEFDEIEAVEEELDEAEVIEELDEIEASRPASAVSQMSPVDSSADKSRKDVVKNISKSIMDIVTKSALAERQEKERKEKEKREAEKKAAEKAAAASRNKGEPETAMADTVQSLENDPFVGVDFEEDETTLNSDDFSYGSFITMVSSANQYDSGSKAYSARPDMPLGKPSAVGEFAGKNGSGNRIANTEGVAIIKERGGVPYIERSALNFGGNLDEKLDLKIKNLVDAVLYPRSLPHPAPPPRKEPAAAAQRESAVHSAGNIKH
jgi:hypothetical protein